MLLMLLPDTQVREARETARQAVALLQELSAFVVHNGPEGDWTAWIAAHAPSAGEWSRLVSHVLQTLLAHVA